MRYEITDDAGLFFIADPNAFEGFLGIDASFEMMHDALVSQMQQRTVLGWYSSCENIWEVEVVFEKLSIKGFREVTGSITAVDDCLCFADWDNMLGCFCWGDTKLHKPNQREYYIDLLRGNYNVRVIQMFEPDVDIHDLDGNNPLSLSNTSPQFYVELTKTDILLPPWDCIVWES